MTSPERQGVGGMLRAIYLRLPFGWGFRLWIKERLFRWFGPLLKNTDSYRRWQTFGPHATARVNPGPPAGGDRSRLLEAYVEARLREARQDAPEAFALQPGLLPPAQVSAKAIAFYLPQFHPIEQNDRWWGRGFTEWTNVSKAQPQFLGHQQPQLPGELGYYDLRLPEVMRRQVELAKLFGIHGFCFYYYWFSGERLLELPLDQYLADEAIDFPFCLCWANENWTRRWDGREEDVLIGQRYDEHNDLAFIRDLLPYLRDRRYIRIDGRPLVVVYRPSLLPDCRQTLLRWRDYCRAQGIGEIFLAMVQFDVLDPRQYGFDAAVEFPPHKVAQGMPSINHRLELVNPSYQGYVVDYPELVRRAKAQATPEYPLFRGVFPRWDNEPRRPGRGYTFANSSPHRYADWLSSAIEYSQRHPVAGESCVFINAWNEWAEGAYLEPDRRFGYAYLQATRDALVGSPRREKILLAVHDAHPHGAQLLALALLRELKLGLGFDVEVLLLGPGRLEAEFAALATVHHLPEGSATVSAEFVQGLRDGGCSVLLANSAVSGRVVSSFHSAGFRIVSLVHELPGLIRDYGLEPAVADLVAMSDAVVVGSQAVLDGLQQFAPGERLREVAVVRPQGLFHRSRYRGASNLDQPRAALRTKLGLPPTARIVLAVGYADARKGVDLFVEVALQVCRTDPLAHFLWVGHADPKLMDPALELLRQQGFQDRVSFAGLDLDTDTYYAGADVYSLTSREDPFPSVVLESLSVGTPVVAFAGTGGGADLVADVGGVVVPAFDTGKYADAIRALLEDEPRRRRLGQEGIDLVDASFSFRRYAIDLVNLAGCALPRVSVILPNFNYARFLRSRLEGICAQTLPPYEIIVLDDASTDNSLEVLAQARSQLHPAPRVISRDENSGSVFRQWLRGVQEARGDYVWIAEADDEAAPEFLERVVRGMQRDASIVLGYCQSGQIDHSGQLQADDYLEYTDDLSPERWRASYTTSGTDEVASALCVKNTIPNVSAAVFRRQELLETLEADIEEIASFRLAGDWVTYLKLLRQGRVRFEAVECNRHRRHSGSVTSASALDAHYREVVGAQRLAEKHFPLSPESRARAAHYADELRRRFGLEEQT